ncbi:MAG: HAD family hydrolase [Gemmatimonadaceae bacterium]
MIARPLVLFDIDGTLTDTNAVDDECFCEAIALELGVTSRDVSWSESPHITDTGIAHWLWSQHRKRLPSAEELSAVRKRFIALLESQVASAPFRFREVPGARAAIRRLRDDGWAIAFATGAWRESAVLKLGAAAIPLQDIPLACADDALSRDEIVTIASERAAPAGRSSLTRVVSVGDGEWDVDTARRRSLPFVGIAQGARAERLSAAGASHVLSDLDYDTLAQALVAATVPVSTSSALGNTRPVSLP